MGDVEEVKSRTNIIDLIGAHVTLKKAGRHFKGLCPFHSEKTPSFIVSPERQSWKCFGCFPPGEMVRTAFGFHEIETIDARHWVISGHGNVQKVIRTLNRYYQGDLVQIRLRKLGYTVRLTSDHNVFVMRGAAIGQKYKSVSRRIREYRKRYTQNDTYNAAILRDFPIQEIPSGELQRGDLLLYPIRKNIHDVGEIDLSAYITKFPNRGIKPRNIPFNVSVNEKLLEFIGYYIAEGSSHRAYLRFSLDIREEWLAKKIGLLSKQLFGLTATIHRRQTDKKTGLELTICHSQLANVFENLCGHGAAQKHVPWAFQELSSKKQKVLLDAIFVGDGYLFQANKSIHKHKAITTVSKLLTEQLTDILLRLNLFPTVAIEKFKIDKNDVHHQQTYRIFWSEKAVQRYDLTYPHSDRCLYWVLPIVEIKKQAYKGPVYNLTIDEDHSFSTASFAVTNCGKGGSAIDFVMEYERVDFVEALETLAEKAGVKLERRMGDTPESKLKEKIYGANHLASEYYHFLLTKHAIGEKARAYLKTRGVTDKTIKTFMLGYSPNSWDGLLKYLKKKGYDEQLLDAAGLIVPSQRGGYDRFRGRIMFTLKDHRGNIVGFSGRLLDPEAKEAKYINTSETPVYSKSNVLFGLDVTKAAIQKSGEAILMEGEFDVISSFQAGVGNSVAIKGSALTEGHVHLLRRFAERLIFALDSDVAGDAAARRGIEIADRAGLDMRVVELPSGKDPDEASRENSSGFKKALKEAIPIYDYFISSVIKRFDPKDAYGKKKISEELLPILSRIENPIIQGHYVKKLAGTLGVSEDAITDGMQKTVRDARIGRKSPQDTVTEDKTPRTREENLELYILALVLQGKTTDIYEKLREEVFLSDFSFAPARQILELLEEHTREHPVFLIKDFADLIPGELAPVLDEAFLWDLADALSDDNVFGKQWEKALIEFKRVGLRRQISVLTQELTGGGSITPERERAIQQELRTRMTTLKTLEKST